MLRLTSLTQHVSVHLCTHAHAFVDMHACVPSHAWSKQAFVFDIGWYSHRHTYSAPTPFRDDGGSGGLAGVVSALDFAAPRSKSDARILSETKDNWWVSSLLLLFAHVCLREHVNECRQSGNPAQHASAGSFVPSTPAATQ